MSIPEINREIKRLEPLGAELWEASEKARREPFLKWLAVANEIDRLKKERARLVDELVTV